MKLIYIFLHNNEFKLNKLCENDMYVWTVVKKVIFDTSTKVDIKLCDFFYINVRL